MAVVAMSASKRINVTPTTSVLDLRIDDVDCSGASFIKPPEDGQFVLAAGKTATAGFVTNAATTNQRYCSETIAEVVSDGAGLAMVWSSAQHGDRLALGHTRVPVIRGGGRWKTKLFNVADDAVALGHANNGYAVGNPVTVKAIAASLQGTAERLVIGRVTEKAGATSNTAGKDVSVWVVGHVTRIVTDSVVAGKGEIEIQLYEQPRLVTKA